MLAGHIAEDHILEPHIAPQGNQLPAVPVGDLPGKGARLLLRLLQASVLLLGVAEGHPALIHLRLLLHHLKDALRAGEGRQQKVDLLGELV